MNKLKSILLKLAPTLAMAVGGPFAGAAVGLISKQLALPEDATEDEIVTALSTASSGDIAKIKQIDAEYKVRMAEMGIDLARLEYQDRDSARRREAAVGSLMPRVLSAIIYGGLLFMGGMIVTGMTAGADIALLNLLLGFFISEAKAVSQYYFGSSSGSKEKTKLLGDK